MLENEENNNKKILLISFIIITSYMIIEIIGGILTNSLALLSDAGHMLSDSIALGISLLAFKLSEKAASSVNTYGYKRFEIIAASLNGLTLIGVSVYIFYEAIKRFTNPPEVATTGMLIVAVIGLFVNIIVAFIMFRGSDTKDNLNMRGAYLHVISDMFGSIGAIIAALLIMIFGWSLADPIASVVVAILVLRSGYKVSKASLHILMEGKPKDINLDDVIKKLSRKEVKAVHDVHLWTITSHFNVLTAHIVVNGKMTIYETDRLLEEIKTTLEELGIQHITIQVDSEENYDQDPTLCEIDVETPNLHAHHDH
ncbi:MAG TPA: cation diffusion facilitator family transporter [Pseudogracilibacillus sp.]|nr:cation diffusion facilitator family transporter [Pseudogracilibacillus sp.]